MPLLRALVYFLEEAFTSLRRSWLISAISVGTIAVSLFVLGAFLTLASNLHDVVTHWTQKVQVVFYLEDGIEGRLREGLENRLAGDVAVESVVYISRDEALDRFRALFRDLRTLPEDLGENPFPASLEVSLKAEHRAPREVQRLVHDFERAPGVQEVQYDLLWIDRLATAVRLVRGVGLFLGGILLLAGVFTISNVIRLTIYAREDELDIMRLVGATQAYVRGPFVMEGMIQGGLGGLVSFGLLVLSLRLLAQDLATASEVLGRASITLPPGIGALLVAGGMVVGVAGSFISLGRLRV
ncbi:MAG TPA: permease-like cell division protein FtsX [Vicinamibacteria bacterium]